MVKVKTRLHKTLGLISVVCILILGISSVVFAASADSDYKETAVHGYTYKYNAGVRTISSYESVRASTFVTCTHSNVPTGYMGAKARLYDSDDNLKSESSWEYNDDEYAGFSKYTKHYRISGDYYSYGQVRLYNGDGYNTYSTYRSPIVTLGGSKSTLRMPKVIPNYQYQVNEYGETYGSSAYADILGEEPDLVAATGIDGTDGYVRSADLDPYSPRTPEEAVALNNLGDRIIPLYEKDGRTVIGQFRITSGRVEYITD